MSRNQTETPPRSRPIDIARGAAVVAMIGYHFSWDLWAFGLTGADLLGDPFWLAARTLIVSSFLFIAGVCAMQPGADQQAALRRRFVRLALGAAAVSAATWLVFPQSWVFFGVLHHMALAGLLMAGLRRIAPPPVLALAAAAILYAGNHQAFDALNAPWLRWLGMGSVEPDSNDYVPLFPWFGVVLAGMAAAPLFTWAAPRVAVPDGAAWRGLVWLGRRSLIIYLLHQPILYGGVWAYVQLEQSADAGGTRAERDFMASCAQSCAASGGDAAACETACLCARDGLRRDDLWGPLLSNALSPTQAEAVERLVRACAPAPIRP